MQPSKEKGELDSPIVSREHSAWFEAATKYDYFMAGICMTASGYLATHLYPLRIGDNSGTAEVLATVLLGVSGIAALGRIDCIVEVR
jgi:hypothetical protein